MQDVVIKRMVVGSVAEPDQYIMWIDIRGQDKTANVHVGNLGLIFAVYSLCGSH